MSITKLTSILYHLMQKLKAERGCILTAKGTMITLPHGSDFPFSRTLVDSVLDEGKPIVTADACKDRSVPESTSILMRQIRSVLCCPIALDGDEAVVYIDSSLHNRKFTDQDLELVQDSFAGLKAS